MTYKSIFYLGLFLIICLVSCKESSKPASQNQIKPVLSKLERLFLETQINRLRVRQTPDLEGAVLKILPQGEIVEYKHDSTRFSTSIEYNKTTYNSSWYKIKTPDNTEGWVYAAFLTYLTLEENRLYLQKKEAQELKEQSNENNAGLLQRQGKQKSAPVQKGLVEQYQKYLAKLPKNDPKSVSKAISKYKSNIIGQNTNTCDAAYVVFDDFYQKVLLFVGRRVAGKYQHLYEEVQRYQSSTMRHDDFCLLLRDNGFNFGIEEDAVILVEDVDFLYRIFYRECSTPMRTWMNQYQKEVPNFWFEDEQLRIPPKTLARWVLSWNYFVFLYPEFIWNERAQERLNFQLKLLLQGSESSLSYDKKTKLVRPEYLEAYRFIVDNYPKSKIGIAFNNYLQLLQDNNLQFYDDLNQKQLDIIQQFSKNKAGN